MSEKHIRERFQPIGPAHFRQRDSAAGVSVRGSEAPVVEWPQSRQRTGSSALAEQKWVSIWPCFAFAPHSSWRAWGSLAVAGQAPFPLEFALQPHKAFDLSLELEEVAHFGTRLGQIADLPPGSADKIQEQPSQRAGHSRELLEFARQNLVRPIVADACGRRTRRGSRRPGLRWSGREWNRFQGRLAKLPELFGSGSLKSWSIDHREPLAKREKTALTAVPPTGEALGRASQHRTFPPGDGDTQNHGSGNPARRAAAAVERGVS